MEEIAKLQRRAIVLLDEAHLLDDWAARLKGTTDRYRRNKTPVHIVATGSSALRLFTGSRETLAGRFERLTLTHWSASSLAQVFKIGREEAADLVVRMGSYPGAFPMRGDRARWAAYVRDAILEPAIGRDILALAAVRRPALLRQVFGVAASSPAQIVSLQKIQGHAGQRVSYWREEPIEVDGVLEGSWGSWAVDVKTGGLRMADLKGLFEFVRRYPKFKPLVIGSDAGVTTSRHLGVRATTWQDFLLGAPPGSV